MPSLLCRFWNWRFRVPSWMCLQVVAWKEHERDPNLLSDIFHEQNDSQFQYVWCVHKKLDSCVWNTPNEARRAFNHTGSLVTAAIERYSASADDLETVVYFLVFRETSEPPRVTKYPINKRLVSGEAPQSESQKAERCKSGWAWSRIT